MAAKEQLHNQTTPQHSAQSRSQGGEQEQQIELTVTVGQAARDGILRPADVLALQRSHGNRKVQRMLDERSRSVSSVISAPPSLVIQRMNYEQFQSVFNTAIQFIPVEHRVFTLRSTLGDSEFFSFLHWLYKTGTFFQVFPNGLAPQHHSSTTQTLSQQPQQSFPPPTSFQQSQILGATSTTNVEMMEHEGALSQSVPPTNIASLFGNIPPFAEKKGKITDEVGLSINFTDQGNQIKAQLEEQIYEGEGGELYPLKVLQSTAPTLKRYIIKISKHSEHDEENTNEIAKLTKLSNAQNIVPLVAVIKFRNYDCPVFEYLPGMTMQNLIEEGFFAQDPDYIRLRIVIRGILQGLAEIQAQSIVHNDLHPGNVMVSPQGGVKLIDFGKAFDKVNDTEPAAGADTEFMAPEQVDDDYGEVLPDFSQDIFRLGQMVYSIIEGVRLGEGPGHSGKFSSTESIGMEKFIKEFKGLSKKIGGHRPKGYLDFIRRMMNPDPKSRMTAQQALQHEFLQL